MSRSIAPERLSRENFAPFGDVLEASGACFPINDGRCNRFHDQARLDFRGPEPQAILSVFRSEPVETPYVFSLMERHPLGSQAFAPMHQDPFLVIVAEDEDGAPGAPRVFLTAPGQGVNLLRNVWHGPLAPLQRAGDFLVVDRGGAAAANLEEYRYGTPYSVDLSV